MREHVLLRTQLLDGTPQQVFPFFSDAHNLEAITPPLLRFRVLTPRPIEMHEGALIEYRLRVHGAPVRWRTRIMEWDEPRRFIDMQLRGPYRLWHHTHTFEERPAGQTLMTDRVRYAIGFGPKGLTWGLTDTATGAVAPSERRGRRVRTCPCPRRSTTSSD